MVPVPQLVVLGAVPVVVEAAQWIGEVTTCPPSVTPPTPPPSVSVPRSTGVIFGVIQGRLVGSGADESAMRLNIPVLVENRATIAISHRISAIWQDLFKRSLNTYSSGNPVEGFDQYWMNIHQPSNK